MKNIFTNLTLLVGVSVLINAEASAGGFLSSVTKQITTGVNDVKDGVNTTKNVGGNIGHIVKYSIADIENAIAAIKAASNDAQPIISSAESSYKAAETVLASVKQIQAAESAGAPITPLVENAIQDAEAAVQDAETTYTNAQPIIADLTRAYQNTETVLANVKQIQSSLSF